jgi:hypothetical protein
MASKPIGHDPESETYLDPSRHTSITQTFDAHDGFLEARDVDRAGIDRKH